MMKLISALRSPFLIACSLLLGLILSSCNLREDILLPPNLDPKEYVLSSRIQVYSDHLIRSENDDSYLYLPKESISDSLIWYGDEIAFGRVENLLARNTLALAEGSTKLSDSYRVGVFRDGAFISFDNADSFATIYTDLNRSSNLGSASLISFEYLLEAENISIYPYGKKRVFFEIDGTGDYALAELSDSMELVIEASDSAVQGILRDGNTLLQVFIPAEFTTEMGQSVISLKDSLEPQQLQTVQELYQGFAMLSKVLQVTTEHTGNSSHPPIIHYSIPGNRSIGTQWLKMDNGRIDSWAEGENTWLMQENKLISFINGSGSYFLLEPLAEQNTLRVSLDGSYNQIYMEDLWLDLRDTVAPGIDLEITANPATQDIMQDYFGLRPYTHYGQLQAYQISFKQGSETLDSLPDDEWLEFGFATDYHDPSNARLMRVYRDPTQDIISYKTHANAYDDTHFSSEDAFVYTGISASGIYLYGHITEHNGTQQVPCVKDKLYLQMDQTTVSYQDSNPPCTAIRLEYKANVEAGHPWLNELPHFLTNSQSIMEIESIDSSSDALPQNLFLQTRLSGNPQSVINISLLPGYPKFIRYQRSNTLEHNSFLYADGTLSISPAYAGYLINGNNLLEIGNNRNLAMFPRMVFDDYDIELYLSSATPMPPSTLRIEKKSNLNDPYQVLQQQYDLEYLSPAYSFEVLNNPGFYQSFQPYVRVKHQSRSQDLLLSVSDNPYYRLYSYPEGSNADGWHFSNADGHYAFVLPHDAEYAIVRDNNPHTGIETIPIAGRDAHLSLYQAQVTVPMEHIGNSLPLGSRLRIDQLQSVPPGITPRSAYRIGITGPQNNPILPGFFSQTIEDWPYLYLPVPNYAPGEPLSVLYRNPAGVVQELQQVQSFSDDPVDEYIIIGNSVVAFINNPGIFYVE